MRCRLNCFMAEAAASALHFSCGVGSEACVRLLLDNGADVNATVRTAARNVSS